MGMSSEWDAVVRDVCELTNKLRGPKQRAANPPVKSRADITAQWHGDLSEGRGAKYPCFCCMELFHTKFSLLTHIKMHSWDEAIVSHNNKREGDNRDCQCLGAKLIDVRLLVLFQDRNTLNIDESAVANFVSFGTVDLDLIEEVINEDSGSQRSNTTASNTLDTKPDIEDLTTTTSNKDAELPAFEGEALTENPKMVVTNNKKKGKTVATIRSHAMVTRSNRRARRLTSGGGSGVFKRATL